jgi:hypothetical protein
MAMSSGSITETIILWPCQKNGQDKDTEKQIRIYIQRKQTYGRPKPSLGQRVEDNRGNSWQEIVRKSGKIDEAGDFSSTNPY